MAIEQQRVGQSRYAQNEIDVQRLAAEAGVSVDQIRDLIRAYGTDEAQLLKAAKILRSTVSQVRSSRV